MIIPTMKFNLQGLSAKGWLSIIALALLILISYLIFPLLEGIVLGVVFAYVGRPIKHLFGKRQMLGSLAGTLCIVIPLSFILAIGVNETINQLLWLETNRIAILNAALRFVSTLPLSQLLYSELSVSLQNILQFITPFIASLPFAYIGRSLSLGILNFLISLPVCYFLLMDGRKLENVAISLLSYENAGFQQKCIERIDSILAGVYLGSIYTAIAGGITSIAIFYLFGVPRPFSMACIVFLAGLVPFLTWLVFIPTAISRYIAYGPTDALLFFLAGSVLVHLAELVIRPYFVHAKSSMHPLFVLLSFLGGGIVAGIAGFFIAPAIMGVLMGIYQIASEEMESVSSNIDTQDSGNIQDAKAAES